MVVVFLALFGREPDLPSTRKHVVHRQKGPWRFVMCDLIATGSV
jgi:hypothetical protein